MRIRKAAAWVLIACGATLIAVAATSWVRGGREIGGFRDQMAEKNAELKTTRKEMSDTNLLYQAFQKSMPSIPDSLRRETGAAMNIQSQKYSGKIRKLQFSERDLGLDIKKLKRREAEATAARKARVVPVAAGAAGALLCGAILAITARPRREAA